MEGTEYTLVVPPPSSTKHTTNPLAFLLIAEFDLVASLLFTIGLDLVEKEAAVLNDAFYLCISEFNAFNNSLSEELLNRIA